MDVVFLGLNRNWLSQGVVYCVRLLTWAHRYSVGPLGLFFVNLNKCQEQQRALNTTVLESKKRNPQAFPRRIFTISQGIL